MSNVYDSSVFNYMFPDIDKAINGNNLNYTTNTSTNPIFKSYSTNQYNPFSGYIPNGSNDSSWWDDFNSWVNNNFKNGWLDFGKFGLGALNTGFGIYSGLKQLGLAKDQLNFTKNAFNTNLANSIKSYNNALEDRARSRYAYMTGNASNADDYINQHKL